MNLNINPTLKYNILNIFLILVCFAFFNFFSSNVYSDQLQVLEPAVHLGVKTCGNSACHAASQPWQTSSVLQNEFITWSNFSSHSKSYKTLTNQQSKRIAKNLGIESPENSKLCLSCHSDYVSEELRGSYFDLADGVGCEACHGGAENWLGQHVSGLGNHQDNLRLGMYPTDNPLARAKLCSSCHVGNQNKSIVHRINGAGHPRLVFELDTFLVNQPYHYRIDEDYLIRKQNRDSVKDWAIGQIISASFLLDRLSNISTSTDGMFPELSLFDCNACHRSISDLQSKEFITHKPGVPRLNDSNLIMVGILSYLIAPEIADIIAAGPDQLHLATSNGLDDVADVAKDLNLYIKTLLEKIENFEFDHNMNVKLLLNILEKGASGVYEDFMDAEQATFAIASILESGKKSKIKNSKIIQIIDQNLERFYNVSKKDINFSPSEFKLVANDILRKLN